MTQLDLREDIWLFLIDSDICGQKESGGIYNANKTMLKRDDIIIRSIDKQQYENISDTFKLTLRFTIVTEYSDPNYDNTDPAELTIPMEAICLSAQFGEQYPITITGSRFNGYKAVPVYQGCADA